MKRLLKRRESGQSMVEYSLILVLVAVACIVVLVLFGQQLVLFWQQAIDQMRNPGHIIS
ncbi:MAG TPA: Flp family type IVb pilin [Candidatus Dormibacteraeota bacterium]